MIFLKHLDLISAVLAFGAIAIYVFSILQGETKPSRSTWWILSLVSFLTIGTSYSTGATHSLYIQSAYLIGYILIAVLSLSPKYGYGNKLSLIDVICICGAFLCGIVWVVFNSPVIAFISSIAIDFIGLLPTINKVRYISVEENSTSWIIGSIAALINLFGLYINLSSRIDWIYAIYLVITNLFITILVLKNKNNLLKK